MNIRGIKYADVLANLPDALVELEKKRLKSKSKDKDTPLEDMFYSLSFGVQGRAYSFAEVLSCAAMQDKPDNSAQGYFDRIVGVSLQASFFKLHLYTQVDKENPLVKAKLMEECTAWEERNKKMEEEAKNADPNELIEAALKGGAVMFRVSR